MSKVLIQTNFDYADEFDVDGFIIYEDIDVYDNKVAALEKWFETHSDYEHWFGTNEAVEIEDIDAYKRGVEITVITDEEAEVIQRLIGTQFGTPVVPEIEDDDDDEY